MNLKGKEVAGKDSYGKRKRGGGDDKSGGARKTRNRAVLQFFEDAADDGETDDSDDSDFGDDFLDEDFDTAPTMKNEQAKAHSIPFFPKEEEMDEEEFDRMMEERYGSHSRFAAFAGEEYDDKTFEMNSLPTAIESMPTIWKVKCTVGREKHSAFCLMQKFVDLKSLGTKLQIISAFSVDHIKGFIYIEAEKQYDINEACKGLSGIYITRVQPVPKNEIFHLFSARSRCNDVSEGMWARVKNGKYKGDLAQVVAVNNARRKATVKLIPRLDFQAMAAKFGGGHKLQNNDTPAAKIISSSELEEFRPLMHYRRDRETGKVFEILDGMMLKDGYLYKKVSMDSLHLWGVVPKDEELLKFAPSENNEANDLEWLSQIYGDPKKKRITRGDKGGGKGEGSSGSVVVDGFELYDLVCFGKKDFGVIISMDKDDTYKILKESPDGPVTVTVERRDIKSGLFDLKLSAQDQHNKTIVVNDTVKILGGPSEGKQGIIKHIYRGVVFIYDCNEEENGGYTTAKSHLCEKIKLTVGDCSEQGHEPDSFVFEDLPSSPKSPLSPKRPWNARENNREFNNGSNDGIYTIGQTLRIRVGPLKGYLCRVIAIRRSDVTVKLDSQQKVLTVKCEHLSEVQGKSTAMPSSDPDSSKPFDLMGNEGSSGGWMDGIGTSTGSDGWNTGGVQAERSAWSNGPASNLLQPEGNDSIKGEEDNAWAVKSTSNNNSSWGAAVENAGTAADPGQSGAWGKGGSTSDANQNSKWTSKANDEGGDQPTGWNSKDNRNTANVSEGEPSSWNLKSNENIKEGEQNGQCSWNRGKISNESPATGWGQGNSKKSGSDDGGNSNSNWGSWKSGTSGSKEVESPSGWNQKSTEDDDKEGKGKAQGDWGSMKPTSSNASAGWNEKPGWKSGSSTGAKEGSDWSASKDGSGSNGSKWGKESSDAREGQASDQNGWKTRETPNDNSGTGWGQSSGGKSRSNDEGKWNSNEKKPDGDSSTSWGQGSGWKSGSTDEPKQASNWGTSKSEPRSGNENQHNWSSGGAAGGNQDSNWGKKSNWNSGSSGNQDSDISKNNWNSGSGDANLNTNWGRSGNENQLSKLNSGCTDGGNQDSSWGKEGHGGNQDSDINKSNWNSGSGDAKQNSNWGGKGNWNSNSASWKSGSSDGDENKNSSWSSGHTDTGNQNSNWGKKSNWNSGSGDANQNSWKRDSSWSSGNDSNGDTSGDGGFGGRGDSDRGFGGRGRGRRDQPGGWNNKRDFGDDSSDWKKGNDNSAEGWKSNSGSGSWNQGGGSNKPWQSWSSGSGEPSSTLNSKGADQPTDAKDNSGGWSNKKDFGGGSSNWKDGNDNSAEGWKNSSGSGSWNQGNADRKEQLSWNQGGGTNKQGQSWSSGSGEPSGNWNSKSSDKPAEAKVSSTHENAWAKGNNNQEEGWNKKPSSDPASGGWGNQDMNQKNESGGGQSSSWNAASSGGAGSWGKKDGSGNSGW